MEIFSKRQKINSIRGEARAMLQEGETKNTQTLYQTSQKYARAIENQVVIMVSSQSDEIAQICVLYNNFWASRKRKLL